MSGGEPMRESPSVKLVDNWSVRRPGLTDLCRTRCVSLVEVVVVVVILGIVAILAIPQFSRAAESDDKALLARRLKVLRVAIERYRQDHGVFPAQVGDGVNAPATEAAFVAQLTNYTDARGRVADTGDVLFCYGPYLRDGIPACSVPPRSERNGVYVITGRTRPQTAEQATAGWVYDCETGQIVPTTSLAGSTERDYISH